MVRSEQKSRKYTAQYATKISIYCYVIGAISSIILMKYTKYNIEYIQEAPHGYMLSPNTLPAAILSVITILSIFKFGRPLTAVVCSVSGVVAVSGIVHAFNCDLPSIRLAYEIFAVFIFVTGAIAMTADSFSFASLSGLRGRSHLVKEFAVKRLILCFLFSSSVYAMALLSNYIF